MQPYELLMHNNNTSAFWEVGMASGAELPFFPAWTMIVHKSKAALRCLTCVADSLWAIQENFLGVIFQIIYLI